MKTKKPIPVIDLFAGPGGLGEGFSSAEDETGEAFFSLKVSIEKDPIAHKTLSLRALFRHFKQSSVPDCYYDRIRGDISREELFAHPNAKEAGEAALQEARHAELGKTPPKEIDTWIRSALGQETDWVLIGGPPCQAYSLAGRSRRTKEDQALFESDEKHFLYKEYLRIIQTFAPAVFVMENVKGMLSSTHGGTKIFDRIFADLSNPSKHLSYDIRSLVVEDGENLEPSDFVIEAERFGVPQGRHRVILFGIRSDVAEGAETLASDPSQFTIKPWDKPVTVGQALSGLPKVRSRLSRGGDSHSAWLEALSETPGKLKGWKSPSRIDVEAAMSHALSAAKSIQSAGGAFIKGVGEPDQLPTELKDWFFDPRLGGVIQHEARGHMSSDLNRYLFAACYAKKFKTSPKLDLFPQHLLPAHQNVTAEQVPFSDRFRVQVKGGPATTVVAHIAKDGHYFIHPDPAQCRSLTVREAARLQTFPDNYFFEGNRTQQYTQVGNAVPPWLARQIAGAVLRFMQSPRNRKDSR